MGDEYAQGLKNGQHDQALLEMKADIAEIKTDLRTLIVGFPRDCEGKRGLLHDRVTKNENSITGLSAKSGVIAAVTTLVTNIVAGFIAWFVFIKRM
ncbi:MAG: hypothetical protein U9Q07_05430 [Planctomycetota bacterium]|nr:hypothetical protein [Planctomycetota bacterium]